MREVRRRLETSMRYQPKERLDYEGHALRSKLDRKTPLRAAAERGSQRLIFRTGALAAHCFAVPRIEANVIEKEIEPQATRANHPSGAGKNQLEPSPDLIHFLGLLS